jgi:prephenate dehydratase
MQRLSLAYLGPAGSFCHQAALKWRARRERDVELVACRDLEEIVQGLNQGRFFRGIIPLENSLEGSVPSSLELLVNGNQQIQGEIVIPVHLNLVSRGEDLEALEIIYSHPHALAQCRRFLQPLSARVRLELSSSTAQAARDAARRGERAAAIASALAARIYGLQVLRENIEDWPDNQTRFVVLGRGIPSPCGRDKTSLLLVPTEDRPGVLYGFLAPFAEAGINLTRIESRPTKRRLGEYMFFLDCLGHVQTPPLAPVLDVLMRKAAKVRILGSYPAWTDTNGE